MEIVERRGHLGLFIRCQWTQWTPRGVRNYKIIITYFLYIQNIDFRWSKKALLRRANLKKIDYGLSTKHTYSFLQILQIFTL